MDKLSLENIQVEKISFSNIKQVASLQILKEDEGIEVDNHFIHILVEKGDNIPGGDPVKEVVFDQVWCFETDEEQQSFLDYIQAYNQ